MSTSWAAQPLICQVLSLFELGFSSCCCTKFLFFPLNVILIAWIQACILVFWSCWERMNNFEMGWSDLPFDLLALITDKVISFSFSDYIRFSCICVQWRYFFLENYEHIKLFNLPILLIPSLYHHHNNDQRHQPEMDNPITMYNYYSPNEIWLGLDHKQRHKDTRNFYSISERKVYDFQLPIPSYLNCRGSSHGWLVVVEECIDEFYPVHLLNPFRSDNNNKIHLPSLNTTDPISIPILDSYSLKKAVVSRSPSLAHDDNELVVLGLYSTCAMGFCRPGDEIWTPLPKGSHGHTFDFVVYQGQFWGILQDGGAVTFDFTTEPKVTLVVDPHQDDYPYATGRYLVESAGDLFQVRRDIHMSDVDYGYSTVGFQVFKLDPAAMKWVKTNTLDGRMFFLGDNASNSISVSNIPGGVCKPNSIYYTDDYYEGYNTEPWEGPHDMGVFNLEDGSFEPHYIMESDTIMPEPIWIQPML